MERRPPPEVELACFRIVQEGVTNVIRHARASCFDVELHQRENELELVVRDDGQGFDLERARAVRETLGLVGMEERVLFLGGQFTVDSSPEHGTEIRALFPLGDE
jgi:signal transduction histidine kinase